MLAAGIFLLGAPRDAGPAALATLAEIDGTARLERGGNSSTALSGTAMRGDDVLDLDASGRASLRWIDGTSVSLHGPARLALIAGEGIRLRLDHGRIGADVMHQPPGSAMTVATPEARLAVIGTRFTLASERGESRLTVSDGRIEFQRHGGAPVTVAAGQWAVASRERDPVARRTAGGRVVIVSSSSIVQPDDAAIADRLRGLGYAVASVDAGQSAAADLVGARFAVISSTSVLPYLRERFADPQVPLICNEPGAAGLYGLVPGEADAGAEDHDAGVELVLSSHALGEGLTSPFALLDRKARLGWFVQVPAAAVVASDAGGSGRTRVVAYEAGRPLADGRTARFRRVGLCLNRDAGSGLSAAGWRMFDAIVAWTDAPPPR